MAPSGVYRCAGDDAWVALACGSLHEWQALAHAIGRPELADDETLVTVEGRRARHDEIDSWISEWTSTRDPNVAMAELQAEGVAAGVVADNQRVIENPHLNARGFFPTVNHKSVGRHVLADVAWRFSRTPGAIRRAAPQLGQHTDYVLRELLGKSEEEIAALHASGVLETVPTEVIALRVASEASS